MSKVTASGSVSGVNYSADEILDIYALGKLWIETGQFRRAETIMMGLNVVAPDFVPAWLGTALVQSTLGNIEAAEQAARHALKIEPESPQAMLFLVMAALGLDDVSTAGTFLGEVGDLIDQQKTTDPNVIRLYKMQLARFQNRGK